MYYFASDMHLGLAMAKGVAERERLLVEWLDKVSSDAEAIFLLGDVFDFWYEYRRVIPKGFSRLLGKLSELTDKGVEIHFYRGNHDMWAYDYLERECGVILHEGTGCYNLYGRMVFVGHGDNMNPRMPVGERIMNSFFRNKTAQALFTFFVHPDLAMAFGHWWSRLSRKSHGDDYRFFGEDEPLVKFSRGYNPRVPVSYFVFGHIHHAIDYDLGDGRRIVFLGDWINNPSYAVLSPDGEIKLETICSNT